MKLRNYGIVMISMLILLGSCFTVAATSISDGTGDIWHWAQTREQLGPGKETSGINQTSISQKSPMRSTKIK